MKPLSPPNSSIRLRLLWTHSANGLVFFIIWQLAMAHLFGHAVLPIRVLDPFPFDASKKHERDFSPSGKITKLSEHLSVLSDTCNVYLVTKDDHALLIGFGSGEVLRKLPQAGASQIDQVLLTHHHRQQAQGLGDLPGYSFQVAAPEEESVYLENAETFWEKVQLYINYNCRSHWNTLRRNIRLDQRLKPGETFSWRGFQFQALSTPGVTEHALSFLSEIDGKKVVFCGSLLSGPGKVPNWFDLHWDYYGFTQGIDASEKSFACIEETKPDLLLPSQGPPIEHPSTAMDLNRRLYARLREMLIPNELHRVHQEVRQILPHLIFVGANCYALLSESGMAFLWDYGYVDRARVEELKQRFKVRKIDAVSFSHYHDDHVIRTWELLQEESQFWVYENMLDVFLHPARYRLPCLLPFPLQADRVLRNQEKVNWEEYSLEFFHLPGQTEFHQGLLVTVDGKKVLFTGDNTWNKKFPDKPRNGPLVPQNEYFLDGGFISCARKMLEIAPDLVCPAHTEEYSPGRQDLEEFQNWAEELRTVMTSLIDQPDPNFGMDYRWCHFYPYRSEVNAGEEFQLELRLRNHLFKPARVEIELKFSNNLLVPVRRRSVTIPAKTQVGVPFVLRRKGGQETQRTVVTADMVINGQRIGEYAEALVDFK
jgi:glyoxylase-like metal-dependent hydrolase (beta-lactamase superfamily II)